MLLLLGRRVGVIVRVHPVQVEVGRVKGEQEQEEDRGRRRRGALTRTSLIAPLVFLPGLVTPVLAVTSQPPSPARTSLPRGHVVRVSRAPPLPLVLDLQHLVTRSRPVVGYTASPNPSPTASSSSTPRSATSSSNCGAANAQRPSASTSHPRSEALSESLCRSLSFSDALATPGTRTRSFVQLCLEGAHRLDSLSTLSH